MKVILTNWISVLGVFLTVFVFSVVFSLADTSLSYNIFQAMLAGLFWVIGYGLMFWTFLVVSLVILDLVLIIPNRKNLKAKLIIEWAIISSPFAYGVIKYGEWIFVAAIIAFFITQLLREKWIVKEAI